MAFEPAAVDLAGEGIVIGAIEQHHAPLEFGLLQQLEQVLLRAARLREDHGFLLENRTALRRLRPRSLLEASPERSEQHFALRILGDGLRQREEFGQLLLLAPELGQFLGCELRREFAFRLLLFPFVGELVVVLVVFGELVGGRRGGLGPLRGVVQSPDHGLERPRDGAAGRRQQLAQDQRDELPLACRQRIEALPLQVGGDEIIEPLLVRIRDELLHQGVAVGVAHVLEDLPAQGALADRRQARLQLRVILAIAQAREAGAEALQAAEDVVVDDADQPVEFEERVLERGGGEQQLGVRSERLLQRQRDLTRVLVHIP